MGKILAKKILALIPTFLAITLVAFFLIRLIPGDPVLLLLGERGGNPETYAQMKKNLGLDLPLWQQYGRFLGKLLKADLGNSIISKMPVWDEFKERFYATLELSLFAFFLAVIVGIPLGVLAAVKRRSFFDYAVMGLSLLGYSMPIFWWGLMLILLFSVKLGLTPVSGRIDVIYDIPLWSGLLLIDTWRTPEGLSAFWDSVRHLILPGVVLSTIPLAVIARMSRSSMLEVLGEDFIRTIRSKGLPRYNIIFKHALRNAFIPIITVMGLMLSTLLTGAILTENIFSWPGIGKWIVASITARDYPVIQAALMLLGLMVMAVNFLVELTYAWANPRLRGKK